MKRRTIYIIEAIACFAIAIATLLWLLYLNGVI